MISVELTKRFKRLVREAGREDEVSAALNRVLDGFGDPHVHAGLSVRKLGKGLYECQTSLALKLVLFAEKGVLTFDFAGNRDEVRQYLHRPPVTV